MTCWRPPAPLSQVRIGSRPISAPGGRRTGTGSRLRTGGPSRGRSDTVSSGRSSWRATGRPPRAMWSAARLRGCAGGWTCSPRTGRRRKAPWSCSAPWRGGGCPSASSAMPWPAPVPGGSCASTASSRTCACRPTRTRCACANRTPTSSGGRPRLSRCASRTAGTSATRSTAMCWAPGGPASAGCCSCGPARPGRAVTAAPPAPGERPHAVRGRGDQQLGNDHGGIEGDEPLQAADEEERQTRHPFNLVPHPVREQREERVAEEEERSSHDQACRERPPQRNRPEPGGNPRRPGDRRVHEVHGPHRSGACPSPEGCSSALLRYGACPSIGTVSCRSREERHSLLVCYPAGVPEAPRSRLQGSDAGDRFDIVRLQRESLWARAADARGAGGAAATGTREGAAVRHRMVTSAMAERRFPSDFRWGTATSSHQVEGGNVRNDWWLFEQQPGRIKGGDRSGLACDWWRNAEADFDRMAALHQNAHRLSLEWSRLEPEEGRWDDAAVARYRQMLHGLRSRAIEPVVTLQHFTLPRWAAAGGGWESPRIVGWFAGYARRCAECFGDLAEAWVPINEPNVVVTLGYIMGRFPPAAHNILRAPRVTRHLLRAHAAAYRAIHAVGPRARVGTAHNIRILDPGPAPSRLAAALDRRAADANSWAFNWVWLDVLSGRAAHRVRRIGQVEECAGTV